LLGIRERTSYSYALFHVAAGYKVPVFLVELMTFGIVRAKISKL